MANFSHDLPVFLHPGFEAKARAIFRIPPTYYLPNSELEFYYTVLADADNDDEARFNRVLACDTNPCCSCFFCADQDTPAEPEDSIYSHRGDDADDERTVSTPSASLLASSTSHTSDQSLPSTISYDSNQGFTAADVHDNTTVWSAGELSSDDTEPSVICLGEDPAPQPIVISSDDSVVTSTPQVDRRSASSSLQDLEDYWQREFRSSGSRSNSLQWESPAKKRPRRGLTYDPAPARLRALVTLVPINVSPVRQQNSDQDWDSSRKHRIDFV